MGGTQGALTAQFEVYTKQFRQMSATILSGCKTPFRDTATLDKALSDLKAVFAEADAALAKYGVQNTPLSPSIELELNMLGARLKSQIEAVVALFPDLEAADLRYIQSAKVATLDQPALKGLEEKLTAADAAFAANLTSMIPPGPGGEPVIPGQDTDFPDTDGDDIENIPDADEIDLIDG